MRCDCSITSPLKKPCVDTSRDFKDGRDNADYHPGRLCWPAARYGSRETSVWSFRTVLDSVYVSKLPIPHVNCRNYAWRRSLSLCKKGSFSHMNLQHAGRGQRLKTRSLPGILFSLRANFQCTQLVSQAHGQPSYSVLLCCSCVRGVYGIIYVALTLRNTARRQSKNTSCIDLWLASVGGHIPSCFVSSMRDSPESGKYPSIELAYVKNQYRTDCACQSQTGC